MKQESWGFEMGIVSTVLGFSGFGVGVSAGLVIGYYLFIFFQPTDVKVIISVSVFFCVYVCMSCGGLLVVCVLWFVFYLWLILTFGL